MSDEDYKDLIITHDKQIDKIDNHLDNLAKSVGDLSTSISASNRKMEDFTTMLSQQNVIMEKFANMDKELTDSFKRVHQRIDNIEKMQGGDGCRAISKLTTASSIDSEKLAVANNRISDIEDSLKWITRLIIGGLVSGAVGTLFILART